MKIAHVVSTFPPYRGGMGNAAYNLCGSLSDLGHDITALVPKHKRKEISLQSSFRIKRLPSLIWYGNAALTVGLTISLFKYEIVHMHYPFFGGCLAILVNKFLRRKKIKFIFHYHMDLVGRGFKRKIFQIYEQIYLRKFLHLSDKIVVSSQDYLEVSKIASYYKKHPEKFAIVPNGVDVETFRPAKKNHYLLEKYGLKEKKVLLFVGALDSAHYFKGVNYLISAFKELKRDDCKLIIVGEGNLRQIYEELVESFNLSDRVIFTGYVPDEDLVRHYNLSDILILPSVDASEAFGMVLVEAMACAKPVIASRLPGVRSLVDSRLNGLSFNPKDIPMMVARINELLDDPELCFEFGQNGREKVETHYSWPVIASKLEEVYKSI